MRPMALDAVEALGAGMTDADLLTDLQAAHGSALYDFARHQGLTDDQAADASRRRCCACGASCGTLI